MRRCTALILAGGLASAAVAAIPEAEARPWGGVADGEGRASPIMEGMVVRGAGAAIIGGGGGGVAVALSPLGSRD
jgi:hypothetical protein